MRQERGTCPQKLSADYSVGNARPWQTAWREARPLEQHSQDDEGDACRKDGVVGRAHGVALVAALARAQVEAALLGGKGAGVPQEV